MQIIKISSKSYKIILSHDELCCENSYDKLSEELINQILCKTRELYGCDFDEGTIDADFFESKDGGGELFISQGCSYNDNTYLFKTESFEVLSSLCKRLQSSFPDICTSLYKCEKFYYLILQACSSCDLLLSILKEYGNAAKISTMQKWFVEEHSALILNSNACKIVSDI